MCCPSLYTVIGFDQVQNPNTEFSIWLYTTTTEDSASCPCMKTTTLQSHPCLPASVHAVVLNWVDKLILISPFSALYLTVFISKMEFNDRAGSVRLQLSLVESSGEDVKKELTQNLNSFSWYLCYLVICLWVWWNRSLKEQFNILGNVFICFSAQSETSEINTALTSHALTVALTIPRAGHWPPIDSTNKDTAC